MQLVLILVASGCCSTLLHASNPWGLQIWTSMYRLACCMDHAKTKSTVQRANGQCSARARHEYSVRSPCPAWGFAGVCSTPDGLRTTIGPSSVQSSWGLAGDEQTGQQSLADLTTLSCSLSCDLSCSQNCSISDYPKAEH